LMRRADFGTADPSFRKYPCLRCPDNLAKSETCDLYV
jgi:hypothetical protein